MATLILICGLPGTGKTTLAQKIEQERPALRLCPDDWIAELLADMSDGAELHRLRDPVEALQWRVACRVLTLGGDVILEWGFWSRAERLHYRAAAEALGAHVKVIFLEVEREELWERISRRNADLPPGTFSIAREDLEKWWSQYEPPTPDELALDGG